MPNSAAPKTPSLALSRRNILNAAASTALVLAFGAPTFALAGKGESSNVGILPIEPLTLLDESLARAFIGSDFDMSSDTASAKLRLSKVAANSLARKNEQAIITQSFSMEFDVLSNMGTLAQETYSVTHSKLGAFRLFLVPHTDGNGKNVLVATFNRFK